MPRPLAPIRTSFFASLNEENTTELLADEAHVFQNLYRDFGHLVRRAGTRTLGDAALYPDREHDGLAWFRIGSADVLFAAHNGAVVDWLFPVPGTALTNSAAKLTAGRPASFAFLDGKVYAADGQTPMIRLTATRADQAMVQAAPAPSVADAGVSGVLLGSTTYSYRVAFLSADAQPGVASPAVSFTRPASTGRNRITLPLCPAGQDCSGRRIYRLPQGSTTYKVVADVLDNTTTVYDDNVAENALTQAFDGEPNLTNSAMPSCAILVEHEGRLCGAANSTESLGLQTLFISNYRQPWDCPVLPNLEDPGQGTRLTLQGAAAGTITGIASHGDKLWVFTAGALHVLVGDEPLDYSLKHFANHGCVSHRTIQSLQDRLVWLAPDGVYSAAEGQGLQRISKPIQATLDALTPAQLARTHSVVLDQRYYLLWPAVGAAPGGCRWVDFKYRPFVWGANSGSSWAPATSAQSVYQGTARPRLFGSLAGHARVVELETGTDDDGTAIPTVWESGASDLGNPGREKRLQLIGASWEKATGTATVKLLRGSGELIQTETQDLSVSDVTGGTVCRLLTECVEQARDERFATRIEYAGDAATYKILATDGFWSLAT